MAQVQQSMPGITMNKRFSGKNIQNGCTNISNCGPGCVEYENTKTWISQDRKELFRWNKKHFSYFLKGFHLVRNLIKTEDTSFKDISHDVLLSKLNHYSIRGVALDWFKSYLSDRTQYATTNNERSEIQTLKYDAPQGPILGSLLFRIYINDLINKRLKNTPLCW